MAVCRHHSGVMFLPEISGAAFNAAGTHFVCRCVPQDHKKAVLPTILHIPVHPMPQH